MAILVRIYCLLGSALEESGSGSGPLLCPVFASEASLFKIPKIAKVWLGDNADYYNVLSGFLLSKRTPKCRFNTASPVFAAMISNPCVLLIPSIKFNKVATIL